MVRSDYNDQGIDLNVEPESSIPCSICFDLVTYDGDRSRAKLKCGHEFHLEVVGAVAKQNGWIIIINDCIGSAFNAKGAMQCPNCRSVEKGQWKYSSGSLTSPELGVDDGSVDHYPFYLTLAETPYRVHICPFRGFTQFHPSSQPSIGVMSALTPMVAHQHPGASGPHPHGWVQFQPTSFLHPHQASGLPVPISSSPVRFDTQRNMPRFVPLGQLYEPNPTFSYYADSSSRTHPWSRDNGPHFLLP
ncbi:unnamed protein product [Amaranthus hypochondriacus]